MNIVTATTRHLGSHPEVPGLVKGGVHKWRLKGENEGTGTVAVVVTVNGSWHRTLQTARFPRLRILIHADVTRNAAGMGLKDDAFDRAMEVYRVVDEQLHVPERREMWWGGPSGVRVLGSNREVEPSFIPRPGTDVELLMATYDVKVG